MGNNRIGTLFNNKSICLYRIEAPHFVAGFDLDAKTCIVVFSAPIIAYMCGKSKQWVLDYCKKKGWKIERVKTW